MVNDMTSYKELYDALSSKAKERILQRSTWHNGSTSNLNDMENIKANIINFDYYSYIIHTPDVDDTRLHIHFIVRCNGSLSVKSVAETLGCDYGVVQATKRPRSYHRYLIHKDNEDKGQYSVDDVISSSRATLLSYLSDSDNCTVKDIYNDLLSIRRGIFSIDGFLDKYQVELSRLNISQKVRLINDLIKME